MEGIRSWLQWLFSGMSVLFNLHSLTGKQDNFLVPKENKSEITLQKNQKNSKFDFLQKIWHETSLIIEKRQNVTYNPFLSRSKLD